MLERFGGFLLALVALALPIAFLPSAADTYILPRASMVIAGACLGVGVSLLVTRAGGLGNLRLPLLAAAAAALLAFAFSVSWPLSLAGSYTRYESLPIRLAYLGLAASAVWLLRTRLQRDAVVAAFVFGTTVASLEAIQQAFGPVAFRPDGNLGNANLLAALIAMAIPLAVDRARRATLFVGPWAASVVAMGAGLVVTTSRSGGLGVVAGCLALLTLAVPRRWTVPVGAASASAVAAAVAFVLISPLRALNDDPAALRLHLWQDGLGLLAARPLTGWGEDTTGLTFGRFLTHDYATLVTFDRVHSGPLDIAVTQGVLGLAALGWVLVVVGLAAWRRRDEPGVAGLAGALAGFSVWVFYNFDWAPATGAFWLLLGTLWSTLSPVPIEKRVRVRGLSWQPPLAAALVAVAVALAVLPLFADTWYLKGHANLSVQADPLQAQYHWALGTIPGLRRAAELGEYDPGMYVQLGDLESAHGDIAAAKDAYRRALEIDPYYTPATQRLTLLTQ
ncbi:MAG TPA: O-antigen ligase family protein [Candidatus Dormibacteraeota bacterium]|nr:O-antigen ligase family protein [Candidatus Dormibacteraeota bacterium]